MSAFEDDLKLLEDAAVAAGDIALRYFRKDPKVWWKEGNSPVSEADFAVNDFLKDRLLGARPDCGWVSEETEAGGPGEVLTEAERFFVVDPIDGTRSYLRGEPTWCVALALVEKGRPVAGVVHAAALGETFLARHGGKASLNGAEIAVSRPGAEASLRLAVPDSLKAGMRDARDVEFCPCVPSLAYRLALVACGRIDGTLVRSRANDWDIAAADLLIECAGGLLCDRDGEPNLYRSVARRHGVLMAGSSAVVPRLSRMVATVPD